MRIIGTAQPPQLDARAARVWLAILVKHGDGDDDVAADADVGRVGLDVNEGSPGVGGDGVHRHRHRQHRQHGTDERREGDNPPAARSRHLVHPRTPHVSHRKPKPWAHDLSGAPPPVGAGHHTRRPASFPPLVLGRLCGYVRAGTSPGHRGTASPSTSAELVRVAGAARRGRHGTMRDHPAPTRPRVRGQGRGDGALVRRTSSTTARRAFAAALRPRSAKHSGARRHRRQGRRRATVSHPGTAHRAAQRRDRSGLRSVTRHDAPDEPASRSTRIRPRYAAKTSCGSPISIGLLTGSALHSNQPPS